MSAGRRRLPATGLCSLEPPAGGRLVRAAAEPVPHGVTRAVLDLARPRRWSLTVSWSHEPGPRHAELLHVLADTAVGAPRRPRPSTCSAIRRAG